MKQRTFIILTLALIAIIITVVAVKCGSDLNKAETISADEIQITEEPEATTAILATNTRSTLPLPGETPERIIETQKATAAEPATEPAKDPNLYLVAGHPVDPVIVDFLKAELERYGIGWWLVYGKAQIFQESRFNALAENRNGLDKGILQYRITYWSALCAEHGLQETTIFDWRTQIRIYVQDTARRLASGCSIEETISRHMMSDYGPYCETYVNDVMRWAR